MNDVTRILSAIQQGEPHAAEQLLPLVYDEPRKLAVARMAAELPGQTLQPTALVHEAYLRLVGDQHFDGRRHFFAAAAEAMRRILVESARRKRGPKHGGGRQCLEADLDAISAPSPSVDLLPLDDSLNKLAREAPLRTELVKLRFFAGLTMPDAAQALGISLATAERYWTYARTWPYAELNTSAIPPNAQKGGSPREV